MESTLKPALLLSDYFVFCKENFNNATSYLHYKANSR